MAALMPSAIVLIVCKTVAGDPALDDPNAKWTGHENRQWAYVNSMMQCRRHEIELYDQAAAMGASAQPFNQHRCMAAGLMAGVEWDQAHKSSRYRFWKVACPTPVVDTRTGEVIAWHMPDCGSRETVVCEVDTAI